MPLPAFKTAVQLLHQRKMSFMGPREDSFKTIRDPEAYLSTVGIPTRGDHVVLTSTISPHGAPPVKLMALAWNDNKRKLFATKPEGLQVDCAKEILSEQKTAMPPPWRTPARHK